MVDTGSYYIGVDVGTGSARACLIDGQGTILAVASKDISRWQPKHEHINQSSREIWEAIIESVKKVVAESNVDKAQIKGLGFDATCSLVVIDEKTDEPVAVGPDFSNNDQNIILWMDHRAGKQTSEINATKDNLLKYVGGGMSIEMEIPKVKWLKENMPAGQFERCKFYDLADYLTHRATSRETRSFCSVVCKQGYVPVGVDGSVKGWSADFLNKINLSELVEDNFRRVGGVIGENGEYLSAGERVGYLTQQAADDLGLTTNVAVGSGVIDAYAGWIGTVASKTDASAIGDQGVPEHEKLYHRLAAVAGTSTCHLALSKDPIFVPGVWGPYKNVVIPDMWLAEGGQSTTGELLHFVLNNHPASQELKDKAKETGVSPFEVLNGLLEEMRRDQNAPTALYLARHYFYYGDLYGNRSPFADPSMRGSIVGKDMDVSLNALAIEYLAAVEFIGQQTRHIIDAMNKAGHSVDQIYLSGGQARNTLLTKIMATATNMPVIIPKYIDAAVVLGAAMLGAKASSDGTPLWDIMCSLTGEGTVVQPDDHDSVNRKLLEAKYEVFLDQAERQRDYRKKVDQALAN